MPPLSPSAMAWQPAQPTSLNSAWPSAASPIGGTVSAGWVSSATVVSPASVPSACSPAAPLMDAT